MAKTTHKRFANAKDFLLLKNGKSKGIIGINERNPKNEKQQLLEFVQLTGADQVFLIWTARTGNCREEVVL